MVEARMNADERAAGARERRRAVGLKPNSEVIFAGGDGGNRESANCVRDGPVRKSSRMLPSTPSSFVPSVVSCSSVSESELKSESQFGELALEGLLERLNIRL